MKEYKGRETLEQKLGLDDESNAPEGVQIGDVVESNFTASDVEESARQSLDFLAGLLLPTVFKYLFPPMYLAAWEWLLSYINRPRDFSQLALGLPRGFVKTTFVKIFVVYCLLFTKKKFIAIFAETQAKANNIVSDIMDMISGSNIIQVFGDWRIGAETDRQDLKKFGFRGRNIVIWAGTVETARGINLKHERPDVMVFDDIQSRQCAESQVQSEALEREMIGTAMKAKSPHGCIFIFVGNMYPTKHSILRHLKSNPNWVKFIVGGILSNGTSLWEELQPLEQLMRELENDMAMGHPEIFFSEVLNDENAASNNLIDLSKLKEYPFQDDDIPAGNFIVIDPSGNKSTSDAVAIGYFEVHNGYAVLREIYEERMSPGETIAKCLEIGLRKNCRLIVVESVAYQATFNYWFQFICDQRQIMGFECVEIYPGSTNKNARILNTLKMYGMGEIYVHPEARTAVHLQITQWNPMKRDNADGILDLLGYAPRVLEEFGAYVISQGIISEQEYANMETVEFNSPF